MPESWNLLYDVLPTFAIRIGAALLCGILLGIERERKDKPAGLRTIVLITVGATVYMLVSELIPLLTEGPEAITRADPSRIAAQVVSGVGFLGAGTIIQARGSVHGLTTAAVIWVSAGIGLCVGIGFPLLGIAITMLVLMVLVALNPIRRWLSHRGETRDLELIMPNDVLTLQRVEQVLQQHGVARGRIRHRVAEDERLHVTVRYIDAGGSTIRLLDALARVEGVSGASYTNE